MANQGDKGKSKPAWEEPAREAAQKVMAVLLTAGGLLGFVAFAGGVVIWSRLYAVEVPPEQAVAAVPRGELVTVGAAFLLLAGFFGGLAAIAVYLIDRGGRASQGMSKGLLFLFMAEGLALIFLSGPLSAERWLAAELLTLLLLVAIWATSVGWFVRLRNDLPRRKKGEEEEPLDEGGLFRTPRSRRRKGGDTPIEPVHVAVSVGLAVIAGLTVAFLAEWLRGWSMSLAALGAVALLAAGVTLGGIVLAYWLVRDLRKGRRTPPPSVPRRPYRLELKPLGILVVGTATIAAVLAPTLVLWSWWVAVALAVGLVLTAGLWRIAAFSEGGFFVYGLAVFISVPLFGTFATLARSLDDPQVQPVAIIRSSDGPSEAIQGLYVTETDKRVYFANVATEGCDGDVKPNSGRLLWVPSKDVVAMSIGPHQSVSDAGRAALEMSYALTPAVETPVAGSFKLTTAERKFRRAERAELRDPDGQRLENAGPAVRPSFGAGLRLTPELAAPGGPVELRMSAPSGAGFGARPGGRALRLDGVPLALIKEKTRSVDEVEFVKTVEGKVLGLSRAGLYAQERPDSEPIPLEALDGKGTGRLYLRLKPGSKAVVTQGGLARYPKYLEVTVEGNAIRFARDAAVRVEKDQPGVGLEPYFLRQAWDPDRIRFRVPDNASTGVLTLECEQLGGQPLLRVARAPVARVAVRVRAGSRRVVFDARRSSDDDEKPLSLRWTVAGVRMGHGPRLATDLPPRLAPYAVRLTVTDSERQQDSVALRLLRLPSARFAFGSDSPRGGKALGRVRRAVRKAVGAGAPTHIELHGHADAVGTRRSNLRLSKERVEKMREMLFKGLQHEGNPVPMTVRAFGETCPIVRRPGRQQVNRRVEVFLLDEGATVDTAKSCSPGHLRRTRW